MQTMQFPTTAAERDALDHCLSAYLDNEGDKSEGIGSELSTQLNEWLARCRRASDDSLTVGLLELAHIQKALDTYQEDPDDDLDQAVVLHLLSRIERAYPAVIPPSP